MSNEIETLDAEDAEFEQESQPAPLAVQVAPVMGLYASDDPDEIIRLAARDATAIDKVIRAKNLVRKIGEKEYVEVAGWQTLGAFRGVFPVVEWTHEIEGGFEARVLLQRGGVTMGSGEAECTRNESKWKNRDKFAIKSMAQTRATGKAFRLCMGWIMVLAGYSDTPAEEMPAERAPKRAMEPRNPDASPSPEATERRRKAKVKYLMSSCPNLRADDWRHRTIEQRYAQKSINDLTPAQLDDLFAWLQSEKLIVARET